jgi:hypothetical protein
MNEPSVEKSGRFDSLSADMSALVASLADHAGELIGV